MSASGVAERTGLPEPTVAKVLKLLAKREVVSSVRGAGGGYILSGKPEEVSVADIVMAVDGPVSLAACVENSDDICGYACDCPVKGRWDSVNAAIRGALEDIKLSDMLKDRPL